MAVLRNLAGAAIAALLLGASPSMAQSDDNNGLMVEITDAAISNRLSLDFDGTVFSGPAWDKLVQEAETAQFFLIGEEHGIAENPLLAAQLFKELSSKGYENLVIETSPTTATALDQALLEDGLDGLRSLFAQRGGEPAFFGMDEEARLLASARGTSDDAAPVLLGVDYEVASDPALLRALKDKTKPEAAAEALDALTAASDAAWAKYFETSGPQYLFSFSGDPELVRAVEKAWPGRDAEAAMILDTLEETLEINKLWVGGQGWQSNARRAAFIRSNFLRHWHRLAQPDGGPKMMIKLGASHLVRGRNMVETFDLGTLLPELAAIHGKTSFNLMVLPGAGSQTAVLDPTSWSYRAAPGKDGYADGMDAILGAALPEGYTLIDMRPLRPLFTPKVASTHGDLARIVHGFDMLLVFTGGRASGEFDHSPPPRMVE